MKIDPRDIKVRIRRGKRTKIHEDKRDNILCQLCWTRPELPGKAVCRDCLADLRYYGSE